ncbi:MAG: hypothetical protein ABI479_06405 [Gallionella sp.]
MEFGSEGIKYLLLVNSGAAVAVLAFHGSVAAVRDMVWPKVMLGFFVVGVILIGALHIARYRGVHSLFRDWQSSVNKYFIDVLDWLDIVNDDAAKARKLSWALYFAYASFACFVIGAGIGMFNFSTLTNGDNHVGKEAITTSATSASNTSTPAEQQDGRGAEKPLSNAEHASTPTNTKEKVAP